MKRALVHAAVVAALATLSLAACQREAGEPTVGQRLDKAIDRSQQKLAQTGEKVDQKLAEAGAKTQEKLNAAGEKIASATESAVSSVKESVDASGKPISDSAITASIKTDLLKDPDLSVLKIDVDTKDGVVTLNGLASDEASRGRAEKLASAIKGVKQVRNYLVVKHA